MNIGITAPVAAAPNGAGGALPNIAADVRQTLSQIAQAPGLSGGERTKLVQATATASSIADPALRAAALNQVSSMGLYLSKTGDSGLPRWTVMTALRAYGLNLQAAPKAPTFEQNAVAAQNVARQVAAVGAERGASLPQALQAAASTAPVVQAVSNLQAKNMAVVQMGGLGSGSMGSSGGSSAGDAADLTTQVLNQLV